MVTKTPMRPLWRCSKYRHQFRRPSVPFLWQGSYPRAVIAMAITSQPQAAGFPLTVGLLSGGLPKRSWVKVGQIRTLSIQRLGKRIGRISPEELLRVVEGLNEIIAV